MAFNFAIGGSYSDWMRPYTIFCYGYHTRGVLILIKSVLRDNGMISKYQRHGPSVSFFVFGCLLNINV